MSSPLKALLWVLMIFQVTHFCSCLIDDEDLRDSNGQVLFKVYEDNKVQLFNLHRTNHTAKPPSIKFSIQGAAIDQIEPVDSAHWQFKLENGLGDLDVQSSSTSSSNKVTQYSFRLHINSTSKDQCREICFFYGYNRAHWFGAYQTYQAGQNWPMDVHQSMERQQFGNVLQSRWTQWHFNPQVNEQFGIMEPLFVNSDGFALLLDPGMPLFIRRGEFGDPVMCFSVAAEEPYPVHNSNNPSYLDLKFHLFAGPDSRTVLDTVIHTVALIPQPLRIPAPEMISTMLWFGYELRLDAYPYNPTAHLEAADVLRFANETLENGFPPGHVILRSVISATGDTVLLQPDMFPELSLVESLHRQGFRVGYQFYEITKESNRSAQFDFSQASARAHLLAQLRHLRYAKHLDSFLFVADGYDLTKVSNFSDSNLRPNLLAESFLSIIAEVGNAQLSEYAIRSQHLPIWTRLIGYTRFFETFIPNMLAVSMAGYSFVVPYTALGHSYGCEAGEESFIRAVQAMTFMPVMSFGCKPWKVPGNKTSEITLAYWKLHQEHVPTILALADERIKTGSPIIRPMWYHAPDDERAFKVADQFMLGSDIVVAPVMIMGHRERQVYLPPGNWLDQHGKRFEGPTEINVTAPLEELPYFKRG